MRLHGIIPPSVKQRAVRKHSNIGRSRPLYLESKELPPGSFHALKAPEPPPAFLRLANTLCVTIGGDRKSVIGCSVFTVTVATVFLTK